MIVSLDAIKPHPDNYNFHGESQLLQLEASYDELGQYRSVVIWQRPGGDYIQVAGHGIVEAMRREGATIVKADVLPEDTDPMVVKRIMLADNLHAQNSEPDEELLVSLLQEQADAGYDLASLGSDEETLRQMLEAAYVTQEKMPEPGDAEVSEVAERWGIIIDCRGEQEQVMLLERFQEEGLSCRALVL